MDPVPSMYGGTDLRQMSIFIVSCWIVWMDVVGALEVAGDVDGHWALMSFENTKPTQKMIMGTSRRSIWN